MSKSAKDRRFPVPLFMGVWASAEDLVTAEADRVVHRCGGVAYMCGSNTRQRLFAIFLQWGL
jgi:hypothetical protein